MTTRPVTCTPRELCPALATTIASAGPVLFRFTDAGNVTVVYSMGRFVGHMAFRFCPYCGGDLTKLDKGVK